MTTMIKTQMPQPSVVMIFITVCLFAGIALFTIYPAYKNTLRNENTTIQTLQKIDAQKRELANLKHYESHVRFIQKNNLLTLPKHTPFKGKITQISTILGQEIKNSGSHLLAIRPDEEATKASSRGLLLSVSIGGRLNNLRRTFAHVLELPYIKDIQEIHLSEKLGRPCLDFKTWIELSPASSTR